MSILLKNRLKYALNATEVKKIVKDKAGLVKVDNRVRRDTTFPCGFMDVVSLNKTGEHFRMLYDVKGRYQAHPIDEDEAKFKLCKIRSKAVGPNKVPYIVTHDGRTIRYPHPSIQINDTIKYNLETGNIESWYKFKQGATVMLSGGHNIGRIGTISHIARHPGSFDLVNVRDARNKNIATRAGNVFVIGQNKMAAIKIPKGRGISYNILEERDQKTE